MSLTNQNKNVTFCCLSYQHGKFLEHCLNSIIGQDYEHIEIIAMDDGSPDGSGDILKGYAAKTSFPIKVILQENSGNIAKNFNTLAKHATSDFISFIAMDDFIEKDAITSKIELLKKDSNLVFVANKTHNKVDQNNNYINKDCFDFDWDKKIHNSAKDLLEIEYKNIGAFYIQGAIFRKKIFDEVGGFDDDLLGDDIILRTKLLKYMIHHPELNFQLLNTSGVNYRIHGANIHQNSLRQITIVKEWKDRYFPEREAPEKLYEWINISYRQNRSSENFINCSKIINILGDLVKDLPLERKNIIWNSFYMMADQKPNLYIYYYLLPYIFCIKYSKFEAQKKSTLILCGIEFITILRERKNKIRKIDIHFFGIKIYSK